MRQVAEGNLELYERELLELAEKCRENAYAPYSGFRVGAAILASDGSIVEGCNVEYATIKGIHAEESALSRLIALGGGDGPRVIVISSRGRSFDTQQASAPCGSCRQAIFEFAQVYKIDTKIICATTKRDQITVMTIADLLPHAFGAKDVLGRFGRAA